MYQKRSFDQVSSSNTFDNVLLWKIANNKHSNRQIKVAGKWSPEEERYATELILAFESGTLDDCEEGTTLRSYLSKKLNCAPMRISKKFAGQGIGKLVYTSRATLANQFAMLHPNTPYPLDECQSTTSLTPSSPTSPFCNNDYGDYSTVNSPVAAPAPAAAIVPPTPPLPDTLSFHSEPTLTVIPFFDFSSIAFPVPSLSSSFPMISAGISLVCNEEEPEVGPHSKRQRSRSASPCDSLSDESVDSDNEAEEWKNVLLYYCGMNA